MYTKEQKGAIKKLLGLSDEQVSLAEEADEFAEKLLKELQIEDLNVLKQTDSQAKKYSLKIQEFLKKRNLWEEVGETLSLMTYLSKEEIRVSRPFGATLCAVLRLIK